MLKACSAILFVLLLMITPTLTSTKAKSDYRQEEKDGEKGIFSMTLTVHVKKIGSWRIRNVKDARVVVIPVYFNWVFLKIWHGFATKLTDNNGKASFLILKCVNVFDFGEPGQQLYTLYLKKFHIFVWKRDVGFKWKTVWWDGTDSMEVDIIL